MLWIQTSGAEFALGTHRQRLGLKSLWEDPEPPGAFRTLCSDPGPAQGRRRPQCAHHRVQCPATWRAAARQLHENEPPAALCAPRGLWGEAQVSGFVDGTCWVRTRSPQGEGTPLQPGITCLGRRVPAA